jgi:hypothetical protein
VQTDWKLRSSEKLCREKDSTIHETEDRALERLSNAVSALIMITSLLSPNRMLSVRFSLTLNRPFIIISPIAIKYCQAPSDQTLPGISTFAFPSPKIESLLSEEL